MIRGLSIEVLGTIQNGGESLNKIEFMLDMRK
jgi:hypothetical protein